MIEKKKFHTTGKPQRLQYFAAKCSCDMGLHFLDGSIIVNAKSYIGIHVLNFEESILIVSEPREFLDMIEGAGEALE